MITNLNVNWHTSTGKWYTHGRVKVTLPIQSIQDLKQEILDNQDSMADGWENHGYYVHVCTTDSQDTDPTFPYFATFLLLPDGFKGMRKT